MGNYTSRKRFQAIYDTVKIVYKTTRNQENVTIPKKRFLTRIKLNSEHSDSHKKKSPHKTRASVNLRKKYEKGIV